MPLNRKRVLIVGAGGFGREVRAWLEDSLPVGGEWTIGGFLDDDPRASVAGRDLPIVATIKGYEPSPSDRLVMALGSPATKLRLGEMLIERGAEFLTLLHPTAVIGERVTLGRGCVLCPYTVITCDVELGDFVCFNIYASAGHDAVFGPGCTLSPYATVNGCARLGRGVFLGAQAAVMPGVEVGDYATVGAGSVAVKRVRPSSTVMGVPAKRI